MEREFQRCRSGWRQCRRFQAAAQSSMARHQEKEQARLMQKTRGQREARRREKKVVCECVRLCVHN